MGFFERRRTRKWASEMLRHARHVRNMRSDVWQASEDQELEGHERAVREALAAGDMDAVKGAGDDLGRCIEGLVPARSHAGLRENIEIIVVAVAVAMGFRTYFIQPFKIPTGSMQPSLFGVHSVQRDAPTLMDRFPLKLGKWLIFGDWYTVRHAKASGYLSQPQPSPTDPSVAIYYIDGQPHTLPKDADIRRLFGHLIDKGDLLWSGVVTRGDHVFVDKVRWNFRSPKRGQIMVFSTKEIATLPQGTHYIKRLSALPNDSVAIDPPELLINGRVIEGPAAMRRIADREPGYAGYWLDPRGSSSAFLKAPGQASQLGDREYLALGDNTRNSRDSRYWGPVPQKNLVGPAVIVYWPFSRRWGLAR